MESAVLCAFIITLITEKVDRLTKLLSDNGVKVSMIGYTFLVKKAALAVRGRVEILWHFCHKILPDLDSVLLCYNCAGLGRFYPSKP